MARYEWRAPRWALQRFNQKVIELDSLEPDSDLAYAIRDEIRSLPGYPHAATESDLIVPIDVTLR